MKCMKSFPLALSIQKVGSNKRWSFGYLYSILMNVCQQWGKTDNSTVTEKENKHFAIEFSFNKLTDLFSVFFIQNCYIYLCFSNRAYASWQGEIQGEARI